MEIFTILLTLIAVLGGLLLSFELYLRSTKNYKNAKKLPGSTMYPVVGSIVEILSIDPRKQKI